LGVYSKDEITEDHMEILIGLHTAIDQKETTIEEAFPARKKDHAEQKAEQLAQDMKGLKPDKSAVDAAQKAAKLAEGLAAPYSVSRKGDSCCDAVSYTRTELYAVYDDFAMERAQEYNNCQVKWPLSPSHLISRTYSSRFALVEKNNRNH